MRLKECWGLVLLAVICSMPACAQSANFNGTWKLNLAKSFMGADHPPSEYRLTKIIAQKDGGVSITDISEHAAMVNIPLPDSRTTMDLTTDGKEHEIQLPPPFPGMQPMKVQAAATWQGCTLEIQQRGAGFGNGKQRLFLSSDGSELIMLVEQHSTYQESEQRLVFEK